MIEEDTIKLLRECDAGIKMGIKSIEEVLDHVKSNSLRNELDKNKREHDKIKTECYELLRDYGDIGKDPNPMASGMSWLKTNFLLAANETDKTIADLMTDGCNMGIKSLAKYLNKYEAADEKTKDIAKRLINLEEDLVHELRYYL